MIKQPLSGIYVSIAALGSHFTGKVRSIFGLRTNSENLTWSYGGAGLAKDVHLNEILHRAGPA